ncbi:MAG TPA: hypothetical protein VH852_02295 [Hyphomicrobium sp.]|jgi:hypothetical protein
MDRILDQVRSLLRLGNDDLSRSTALVVAMLGSLAFLSFVMAGVVGALEKTSQPAEHASITSPAASQ